MTISRARKVVTGAMAGVAFVASGLPALSSVQAAPQAARGRGTVLGLMGGPLRMQSREGQAAAVTLQKGSVRINSLCLAILLMRGQQSFNAHPHLCSRKYGEDANSGIIAIGAFPGWLTNPSYQDLGAGRNRHFLFARLLVINCLLYLALGMSRNPIWRDLLPNRDRLRLRHLWCAVRDHARLRLRKGDEARRYNAMHQDERYAGI